jgi:hypothetical protein
MFSPCRQSWIAGCRVETGFAQPGLVDAFRQLLRAALMDRRNSMFLLVSEACIPLYHPALIWAQLMAESHVSRVAEGQHNMVRWVPEMETPALKMEHFQKSQQWTSLTRMHAELAAYDEHVWTQFRRFCVTQV